MSDKQYDDQIPEEATPKTRDTSFVKRAGKRVWEAIRSLPGEFLNFWKSYPPKARKIAAIVAAVVLVAGVVWTIFGLDNAHRGFYLKNGELYMCTSDGRKMRITENFIAEGNDSRFTELCLSVDLNKYIHLSDDGKKLFYVDHTTVYYPNVSEPKANIVAYDLYWRDLTNPLRPPIKIADNASGVPYYVNSTGNLVTYFVSGTMYQYNMVMSIPVETNIFYSQFHALDDGNTFLYVTREKDAKIGTLYKKKGVGFPEKIDEGISSIAGYNRDFSTVVYMKNGNIYMKNGRKATKMIAQNSTCVSGVFEDNSLYYLTRDRKPHKATEFVIDNLQNSFSKQIMEKLAEKELYHGTSTLWYYDGEDSVKVSDLPAWKIEIDSDGAVQHVFLEYSSELPQLKLSELYGYYGANPENAVGEMVKKVWAERSNYYLCMDGKKSVIPLERVKRIEINDAGTTMYIWTQEPDVDQTLYDLYRVEISGKDVGSPELVTENFLPRYAQMVDNKYDQIVGFISNDAYVYWVATGDKSSDMYMNGNKVDTKVTAENSYGMGQVSTSGVQYNEKTGMLYYLKGYTLMQYDGKKSQKIKDGVIEFVFTEAGDVFFLPEVDEKNELWCWNGKKLVKVDTDVGYLIPLKGQEK